MNREFGTQMDYIGLYIDPRLDKVMHPKKYFDADTWDFLRERTILFLQRMVRGWLARK